VEMLFKHINLLNGEARYWLIQNWCNISSTNLQILKGGRKRLWQILQNLSST